jgi:hypothetical protein
MLKLKLCKLKCSNLDSRSNLGYVVSNVFFSSSFKWDFCAHNAYKDTNLVLYLVNLVITPAEKVFSKVSLVTAMLWIVIAKELNKTIIDTYSVTSSQNYKVKGKPYASVHTYLILLSAVLVTTSAPCSKSSGILLAKRNIFKPWKKYCIFVRTNHY